MVYDQRIIGKKKRKRKTETEDKLIRVLKKNLDSE